MDSSTKQHTCHLEIPCDLLNQPPFYGSPVTLAVYIGFLATATRGESMRDLAAAVGETLGLGEEACRKHLRQLGRSGWLATQLDNEPDWKGSWGVRGPSSPGVYAIFGGSRVLYVGQSKRVAGRLLAHRHSDFSMWATHWSAWGIQDPWLRTAAELVAIALWHPEFNQQGVPT